jgi:hypothetical protein
MFPKGWSIIYRGVHLLQKAKIGCINQRDSSQFTYVHVAFVRLLRIPGARPVATILVGHSDLARAHSYTQYL